MRHLFHPAITLSLTAAALGGCGKQPSTSPSPHTAAGSAMPNPPPTLPTADGPPPAELLRALADPQPASGLVPLLKRGPRLYWGIPVGPNVAEYEWRTLRAKLAPAHYYPLIVTASFLETVNQLQDNLESPEQILHAASQVDTPAWMRRKFADSRGEESPKPDFSDGQGRPIDPDTFVVLAEGADHGPFYLLFLPASSPWEVFAYLDYGNWNAYPHPHAHVAVMQYWYKAYAAEPAVITHDVIEMAVASPPNDDASCRQLAIEQCAYTAGDLIDQGYESFGLLARTLRGRRHWYFWWD